MTLWDTDQENITQEKYGRTENIRWNNRSVLIKHEEINLVNCGINENYETILVHFTNYEIYKKYETKLVHFIQYESNKNYGDSSKIKNIKTRMKLQI